MSSLKWLHSVTLLCAVCSECLMWFDILLRWSGVLGKYSHTAFVTYSKWRQAYLSNHDRLQEQVAKELSVEQEILDAWVEWYQALCARPIFVTDKSQRNVKWSEFPTWDITSSSGHYPLHRELSYLWFIHSLLAVWTLCHIWKWCAMYGSVEGACIYIAMLCLLLSKYTLSAFLVAVTTCMNIVYEYSCFGCSGLDSWHSHNKSMYYQSM